MNRKRNEHNEYNQENSPKQKRNLTAEQWVLLIGLLGFLIFLWMIIFLFFPLLTGRPLPITILPMLVEMAAKRGFILPPTWTPAPTRQFISTSIPTQVYDGSAPTRMYTPFPTSLSGVAIPFFNRSGTDIDLARIMQGESPGDKEAAYMVGWVAKNRLMHTSYGDNYYVVSHGFFGYRADMQPNDEFMELSRQVVKAKIDPTGGAIYAFSRTDITNLGIPPERADVAFGEWFFFRTWPLGK